MRLVDHQADENAGDERAAVEDGKRAGEQRDGEKAVLAVAEIDEHGREGEREEEPKPVQRGALRSRKNRPHRQQIENERRHLPDSERRHIGKAGERSGDQQEHRRILERVVLRGGAEDRLFAGKMGGLVESQCGQPVADQSAGGIEAGKIGAERAAIAVVRAVSAGRQIDEADQRGGQDTKRHQPYPLAGQKSARAQKGNESGHRRKTKAAWLKGGLGPSTSLISASIFATCCCPIGPLRHPN